jgi:UDP-glucose 4-epimerase
MVSQFLRELNEGRAPVIYGDGSQTRDFIYVRDVVRALRLAMDSDYHGILNVGTGKAYSFNQVLGLLKEKLGHSAEPRYVENPIKNYVKETLADTSRARRILGFEARYSLEEGIEELIGHLG